MQLIQPVNFPSFKEKVRTNKRSFRNFLNRLEKKMPAGLKKLTRRLETEVWKEVDCLSCANCCKKMTPTFTAKDIRRISAHFGMTDAEFRSKWLIREKGGDRDWMNLSTPCQFLDLKTNFCSIYAIRPADCAGFPHLSKNLEDYGHVLKQNIEYCPAAFKLVEKMKLAFKEGRNME